MSAVTMIQSNDEFEALIKGDNLVVADFFATWCGPCTQMSPIVDKLAEKYAKENPTVKFVKVNVEELDELATDYSVQGLPTIILFKKGKSLDSKMGSKTEAELDAFIKSKL